MSIKIMTYVWKCAPVKGTELLMLLALADNANDDGICYPSVRHLAQKARINERNAQKTLKSLAKKKLIKVQHNAGKETIHGSTNRYIVYYSDGVSPETPVSVETPDGVSHKTPDGVSPETPKPSIEPSVKPSSLRAPRKHNGKSGDIPADVLSWYNALFPSQMGETNGEFELKRWLKKFGVGYVRYALLDLEKKKATIKNRGGFVYNTLMAYQDEQIEVEITELPTYPKAAPSSNGTSHAGEMQKLTEQRYKEKGLLS